MRLVRRIILAAFALALLLSSAVLAQPSAQASRVRSVQPASMLVQVAPALTCKAYLLYDLGAERTVAVHNPNLRQPIASLTKLMTAILADERLRFDGRYVLTDAERKLF